MRFYAQSRDLAGSSQTEVEVSGLCPSREDLIVALGLRYGEQMERLLRVSAFAVGEDILAHDALLSSEQEVAVLPPVSGGCSGD